MGIVFKEEESDSGLRPSAFAGPKSVLEQMGAFSMYVCGLGDVRALFFIYGK